MRHSLTQRLANRSRRHDRDNEIDLGNKYRLAFGGRLDPAHASAVGFDIRCIEAAGLVYRPDRRGGYTGVPARLGRRAGVGY